MGRKLDKLYNALAVAEYDPTGTGEPLFPGASKKIRRRIKRRHGDLSQVPDFENLGELTPFLSQFASVTGRRGSKVRERVAEESQIVQREKILQNAQDALEEFKSSGDYDKLLEQIRDLPPTLSDEEIALLKNKAVSSAKAGELAVQRRIAANLGIRGAGAPGGVGAMLASMGAEATDQAISQAFTTIDLEREQQKRADILQSFQLESSLLQARQQAELQLQQNIQNIMAGLPPSGANQDFASLLEAIKAQTLAAELERERSSAGLKSGLFAGFAELSKSFSPVISALSAAFSGGENGTTSGSAASPT